MAKANVKKKRSKLTAYNNWGYAFVAPFVIVFCIFSIYPVLRTLYLSFTDLKLAGTPNWKGLANYQRVFTDKYFWRSMWNTAVTWVINIVLQLGLAFLLMMVFSDVKYKMKGLKIYRIVYYLPNLIAATSIAFLFSTLLDWRFGSFNKMITAIYEFIRTTIGEPYNPADWSGDLGFFGSIGQKFAELRGYFATIKYNPIDWLGNGQYVRKTIAVIQSWMWFGNSFLMLMAGVQGVSKDYFEAAAIDGAGRWTIFGKITLPLIKPIMMYVAITSLIGGLQLFDLPYLMVGASTSSYAKIQTGMMYLYKFGFTTGTTNTSYASAIAYTMFLIILVFSVGEFFLFNRKKKGEE